MNDVKGEDGYGFCTQSGIAVICDGASGFHKDFDENDNLVPIKDLTDGDVTSAKAWADKLTKYMLSGLKKGMSLEKALKQAIADATKCFPLKNRDFKKFQTPSATIIAIRVTEDGFEAIGSGDCGMLLDFGGGNVLSIVEDKVLPAIRAKREASIHEAYPNFDNLKKEKQATIRYRFMQQTRESLGSYNGGYFVPYYGGAEKMDDFMQTFQKAEGKYVTITSYGRGDIWTLKAKSVKSVLISSDGFLKKVLQCKLVKFDDLISKAKTSGYLSELGKELRGLEKNLIDVSVQVVKAVNGQPDTGSADDATALFFEII